jgi:hypothetical protein
LRRWLLLQKKRCCLIQKSKILLTTGPQHYRREVEHSITWLSFRFYLTINTQVE